MQKGFYIRYNCVPICAKKKVTVLWVVLYFSAGFFGAIRLGGISVFSLTPECVLFQHGVPGHC